MDEVEVHERAADDEHEHDDDRADDPALHGRFAGSGLAVVGHGFPDVGGRRPALSLSNIGLCADCGLPVIRRRASLRCSRQQPLRVLLDRERRDRRRRSRRRRRAGGLVAVGRHRHRRDELAGCRSSSGRDCPVSARGDEPHARPGCGAVDDAHVEHAVVEARPGAGREAGRVVRAVADEDHPDAAGAAVDRDFDGSSSRSTRTSATASAAHLPIGPRASPVPRRAWSSCRSSRC